MLRRRLESTFIRITARGVQHYTRSDFTIEKSAWHTVSCVPTATALCAENTQSQMLYFDSGEVDVPDDWGLLMETKNSFLERFPNGTSCKSTFTGRTLKIGDVRYELSLCDLLDSNIDIVLRPHENVLHWRVNSMSIPEYVGIALISVYLIASLSHNLVNILTHAAVSEDERAKRRVAMKVQLTIVSIVLAYCLVYFAYSFFSCTDCAGMHIITTSDQILSGHILTLSIVDTIFLWKYRHLLKPDHAGNISLLTSCLLLLLVRVYETTDTPYLSTLVCFFGTRSIYKILSVMHDTSSHVERVTQICDAYVFSSLLGNGIWYKAHDTLSAIIMQAQILLISSLAGVFLYTYKILKEETIRVKTKV